MQQGDSTTRPEMYLRESKTEQGRKNGVENGGRNLTCRGQSIDSQSSRQSPSQRGLTKKAGAQAVGSTRLPSGQTAPFREVRSEEETAGPLQEHLRLDARLFRMEET